MNNPSHVGLNESVDHHLLNRKKRRNRKLLWQTTFLAAFVFILYAIIHGMGGRWFFVFFLGIASVAAVINLFILRIKNSLQLATYVTMAILAVIFFFSVYTGGHEGIGILWIYLWPLLAFFLTKTEVGIKLTAGFAGVLTLIIILQYLGFIEIWYSSGFLLGGLVIFIVQAVLVYLHQSASEQYEELATLNHITVERQAKQLADSNKKMLQLLTEKDKEKTKYRQAKERLEAILESIGEGIITTDVHGNITLLNEAAKTLSGFDNEKESIGRHYKEVLNCVYESDTSKKCSDFVGDVIKTKSLVQLADDIILKKGRKITPVAIVASPIRDNDSNIFGCVIAIKDLTKAREIEQMKTDFLSVAAHQLRTPLGGMRWQLGMLANGDQGELPAEAAAEVERLLENQQRLTQLVDDLLHATRIDQKRVQSKLEKIHIKAFIEDLVKDMKVKKEGKDIDLELSVQDDKDTVLTVDRQHLQIVLENLISNAIKYSKKGGHVRVSLSIEDKQVVFVVSDNGIGIPEKDQDKIFAKFYRAENATKSQANGSGLGLFMAKSFVEAWGGSIAFESTEGEGTTFTVSIPLKVKETSLGDAIEEDFSQ